MRVREVGREEVGEKRWGEGGGGRGREVGEEDKCLARPQEMMIVAVASVISVT